MRSFGFLKKQSHIKEELRMINSHNFFLKVREGHPGNYGYINMMSVLRKK